MKKISKFTKVLIAFMIGITSVSSLYSNVVANENENIPQIRSDVEYSDDKTKASINFDLSDVDTTMYEIVAIKDDLGVQVDLSNPTYEANENGTFNFNVSYIKKINKAGDSEENASDDGYEKLDTTISVEVDNIQSVQKEKSDQVSTDVMTKLVTPFSSGGLSEAFKISKSEDTNSPFINGNTISFSKYTAGLVNSKFTLDFSRSFVIEGTFTAAEADGVSFALHTNPNKEVTAGHIMYNTGMVDKNLYTVERQNGYTLSNINQSQMPNGLLWNAMFTLDSAYSTSAFGNGVYGYYMKGTTHSVLKPISGESYERNVVGGSNAKDFKMNFVCTNPETGDGQLTVSIGGFQRIYSIGGKTVFGSDYKNVYFAMSSWVPEVHPDGTSTPVGTASLTFNSTYYTDWPPTHDATSFWADRNKDGIFETQVNTTTSFAYPNETIQVKHELTTVSSTALATINANTRIEQLKDSEGNLFTGNNPKSNGTSITNNVNAYNTTDISNNLVVPLSASNVNSGKTAFTYEMTAPDVGNGQTTITEVATFGQMPFDPITSTSAQFKVVGRPTLNVGVEKVFIEYGSATINLRDGLKGKTYDGSSLLSLASDPTNLKLTYSPTTAINTSSPGTYVVSYTLKDTRTNLTETKAKTYVVLDKGWEVSPDKTKAINAKDAFIKVSEAKALANKEALITVNDAKVTSTDGSNPTPVVTASDFTTIKAGKLGSYNVTYSYGSGTSAVSKTVKVTVIADDAKTNGENSLNAENVTLTLTQANGLANKDALLDATKAVVTKADGTTDKPKLSDTEYALVKNATAAKTVTLNYSYGSGATLVEKSVVVTITDDGSQTSVNAKDAIIKVSEAQALANKEALINVNSATATAGGTSVTPVVTASDFTTIKAGTLGTYNVTYSYGSGATLKSTTVKVTVVADENEISNDRSNALSAKDAFIKVSEAKALANKEALITVNDAKVTSADGSNPTPVVTAMTFTTIKLGTLGSYNVTYSYGSGASAVSKTVKVTVIADDAKTNGENSLNAENVTLTLTQANGLANKDALLDATKAVVTKVDGTTDKPKLSDTEYALVKNATTAKTVTLNYSYGSGATLVEKSVVVTITDDGSQTSVNAKDAIIKVSEAQALANKEALINVNSATATAGGTSVTPVVTASDFTTIKAGTLGSYNVTYSYGSGTGLKSTTVKVTVVADENEISNDRSNALSAKDAFISVAEAKALANKEALITVNDAKVTSADGSNPTPVVTAMTFTTIKAGTLGSYNVTYSYGSGASAVSKTVKVTVKDSIEENPTNKERIGANDFAISKEEVAGLNNAKVIDLAKAEASSTVDGSKVAITVVDYSAVKAAKGTYNVTFATAKGTSITVKATVKDESITDPKNEEQI
ncbi:hypothetical protein, partial [Breznakia sp. PM6-1]